MTSMHRCIAQAVKADDAPAMDAWMSGDGKWGDACLAVETRAMDTDDPPARPVTHLRVSTKAELLRQCLMPPDSDVAGVLGVDEGLLVRVAHRVSQPRLRPTTHWQ